MIMDSLSGPKKWSKKQPLAGAILVLALLQRGRLHTIRIAIKYEDIQ